MRIKYNCLDIIYSFRRITITSTTTSIFQLGYTSSLNIWKAKNLYFFKFSQVYNTSSQGIYQTIY